MINYKIPSDLGSHTLICDVTISNVASKIIGIQWPLNTSAQRDVCHSLSISLARLVRSPHLTAESSSQMSKKGSGSDMNVVVWAKASWKFCLYSSPPTLLLETQVIWIGNCSPLSTSDHRTITIVRYTHFKAKLKNNPYCFQTAFTFMISLACASEAMLEFPFTRKTEVQRDTHLFL